MSKYSAAMYGHFVGIYEFGRLGPTGMVVLENKDLIRAGEVLYHWPTYNAFMGAKLKIPIVKERKATPEEEKAITEHAIKHELEPHGRHAHKVMDKISEIVGYAGPVVEISALVFAALEPVATALGILASPFLFYDMVMDHLNNRDMNLVIYSVRAMGYATATWAFDLSPVTSSPVVLARLAGPNKAVAANLDKAWKISYDQMLRELPKMAWSFFHAKGDLGMTQHQTELAFKQVLRGAGNDSPADVAEKMMKALALKYIRQGMPRDAFMKGLSVKFPR